MQEELKHLQRQLGVTFIFVTHDQGEALSMADRVAVFNDGQVQQVDDPQTLYDFPQTPFVADFVGSSNVLLSETVAGLTGIAKPASLRPENIRLASEGLQGVVVARNFLGAATRLDVQAAGANIKVLLPKGAEIPADGETVNLAWDKAALHVMDHADG